MITVFIRTIIIYVFLIAAIRFSGKRQVGELEPTELIITMMLSELASYPILDKDIPLSYAIIPITLLLCTELIISYVSLHSPTFKSLIAGKPSYIIMNGKLSQKELSRQRLCLSELLCALRQNGISDIADVDCAVLEESGKLSVFLKPEKAPITPERLGVPSERSDVAHLLIIDGRVSKDSLKNSGWTLSRLDGELKNRGIKTKDVFLFSLSADGEILIIPKENQK